MKTSELIEVLRLYAKPTYCDYSELSIVDDNGDRHSVGVKYACKIAADKLEKRDVNADKFIELVGKMKRAGLDGLYKRLMGEEIAR